MRTPLPAILVAALVAAAPALATEVPPPPPAQPAPPLDSLAPVLGKCHDTTEPHAGFSGKSARVATRTGTLRGTAKDAGCGVAIVTFSIARVAGHGCRIAGPHLKLGRRTSCSRNRWMLASGTARWRVALADLPRGTYRIRVRAIDYAGNVQNPRVRTLRLH